jgi:hypothetical protein
MNDIKNDKNLREAVNRREQQLPTLPDHLNERVMKDLMELEMAPKSRRLWWGYAAVAVAASIALLIVFNYRKQQSPQEPIVAQQMVKPAAVPSQPVVEESQPEVVPDEQPEARTVTELSEDVAQATELASAENVKVPRHLSTQPILNITSPNDGLFFLASTSYMVTHKSYRDAGIRGRFSDPIYDENGITEPSSDLNSDLKTASQNRPQIPSIKDNLHKLTKKERRQMAVLGAIDMKRWHIDINTMNTMRYGSRTVTPDFFLELRGDTLRSYLPYLGQAQVSQYSPAIGLNFEEPVRQYKESKPKSNKFTQLDIDVKTREDSYHYVIDIYDSGEATIRVRSQYRDPISFDGTLEIE